MTKDQFGMILPQAKDIAAIDGAYLITVTGERISRDLYEINKALGGGFSLVSSDEFMENSEKASDKQ